jgi:hypothetical protein
MSDSAIEQNLVGYCGLYCGACEVLRLHQEGQSAGRAPDWSDLPEEFRRHLPFKPAPVRCHGCRSDTVFAGCAHCPLRVCAKQRGIATVCADCEKYPCLRIKLMGLVVWLFGVEKKLPHQRTKRGNLERIRSIGVAEWLREQDRHWRCPECQTQFSWYRRTCGTCGQDLRARKGFD